jgi:hypothetical protein
MEHQQLAPQIFRLLQLRHLLPCYVLKDQRGFVNQHRCWRRLVLMHPRLRLLLFRVPLEHA